MAWDQKQEGNTDDTRDMVGKVKLATIKVKRKDYEDECRGEKVGRERGKEGEKEGGREGR